MRRLTLQHLIVGLSLFSVLIALGNSFYASHLVHRKILEDGTLDVNRAYAAKLADITSHVLDSGRSELAYAATELRGSLEDPDALRRITARIQEQNRSFNSVLVIGIDGRVTAASPRTLDLVGTVLATPETQRMLQHPRAGTSEPFFSFTRRWVVVMHHPLFDEQGAFRGILAGSLYLHEDNVLHGLLSLPYHQDGSYFYVASREGTVLYHPERARIGQPAPDDLTFLSRPNQATPNLDEPQANLVGHAVIPELGWHIVTKRPLAAALARLDELTLLTMRYTVPLLVLSLLAIWYMASLISRPLSRLAHVARYMGARPNTPALIRAVNGWYFEAQQMQRSLLAGLDSMHHTIRGLRRENGTDALTGLLNRRGLNDALQRLTQTDTTLSVITLDVDHFKRVNDTFGHDCGDLVLARLAGQMREQSRDGDYLIRSGGEEFMILLPGTSLADATQIAERLRRSVAGTPSATGEPVTISLGVARMPDHASSPTELFKRGDNALYDAKRAGRNRTHVCQGNGPQDGSIAFGEFNPTG